jgi:hypothetical protein
VRAYSAQKYFSNRDGFDYDISLFYQLYKNKDALKATAATNKHASDGGCKPTLVYLEDILAIKSLIFICRKLKFQEVSLQPEQGKWPQTTTSS